MIEIGTYSTCDKESVIALVLHCQNDGTRPLVGVEDQSDLLHIEEEYIYDGGNFWVAKENGKVAGTIGLMNKGNGLCILKKFFVYEPYRGKPHNLGQQLYGKPFQANPPILSLPSPQHLITTVSPRQRKNTCMLLKVEKALPWRVKRIKRHHLYEKKSPL